MIERVIICPPRYAIWCDGPGCDAQCPVPAVPTTDEACEAVDRAGWRREIETGRAYCPDHREAA